MELYTSEITNDDILNDKNQRWKTFCLDFNLWNFPTKKIHNVNLEWNEVKFDLSNRSIIPNKQGVYIFLVKSSLKRLCDFDNNFILYVGQAKNLEKRFTSYFNYESSKEPSDQLKRIMTLIWKDYLFFNYAETNLKYEELNSLEFDLIDSIIPPINLRFRADVIKQNVKLYSPR